MADRRAMSWLLATFFSWPIGLVLGYPWIEPRKTKAAMTTTADSSPAPTRDVSAEFHLLRRDVYPVSVCGWIGAKVASPAYCSTSSSCVWNLNYNIVGCCTTSGSNCAFYTSCIDLNSPKPVGDRSDIYTCRGTSVCYLNTYPNYYHQWGCGAATWATTIATTYPGMGADLSLQIVFTGAKLDGSSTSGIISTSSTVNSTFLESNTATQTLPPPSGTVSPVTPPGSQTSETKVAQISTSAAPQSPSTPSDSKAAAIGGGIGGGLLGALTLGFLMSILYWHYKDWLKIKINLKISKKEDVKQVHHKTILEGPAEVRRPLEFPVEDQHEMHNFGV